MFFKKQYTTQKKKNVRFAGNFFLCNYVVLSPFHIIFDILYTNQPKKSSQTFPEIKSSLTFPEFRISLTFPWHLVALLHLHITFEAVFFN